MAPKRKAAAASRKEENGEVTMPKKRGRPPRVQPPPAIRSPSPARSASPALSPSPSPPIKKKPPKKAVKTKLAAKNKVPPAKKSSEDKEEGNVNGHGDEDQGEAPATESPRPSSGALKYIVIEHCKQCQSFKTRAAKIQDALEKSIPGLHVLVNPDKPRKGCFEIRDGDGNIFVSLKDMPRPFKKLKALDLNVTAADIVAKLGITGAC